MHEYNDDSSSDSSPPPLQKDFDVENLDNSRSTCRFNTLINADLNETNESKPAK